MRFLLILLPLAGSLAQTVKVGGPAPPLTFRETIPSGLDSAWPALRGKPVVLEFWATWCGNCIAHIPQLNELASKFPQVQFISVSDEDGAVVKPFLAKRPISGWVALDRANATFQAYGVEGRPQTMLIDSDGVLRGIMHPAQVTEAVLNDLIAARPVAPQKQIIRPLAFDTRADPVFALVLRPSPGKRAGNFYMRAGMLQGDGQSLRTIIAAAYSTPDGRLEGPEDLLRVRYDFCVLLPDGMSGDWELLRRMLEHSMKLKVRREKREPVEAFVLKRAGAPPQPASPGRPMWLLAGSIENRLKRMVLDETGLDSEYALFPLPDTAEEIGAALRERLHVELVPERRPREVLVVESITLPAFRTVSR